jgi:hypothetical protein
MENGGPCWKTSFSKTFVLGKISNGAKFVLFSSRFYVIDCSIESRGEEIKILGLGVVVGVGCPRNSADTEFRRFFLLPSIPYSVRNWLQFRRNSAEFRDV